VKAETRPAVIGSPFLAGRDRYERALEGRVDDTAGDAFTHTVQVSDDDGAVEVAAVCTPSPRYEVVSMAARIVAGPLDPAIPGALGGIAGARMAAGFTRRLAELCGGRRGTELFVDAGIEVARLARQVAKLPAAAVGALRRDDPSTYWQLDTAGWEDLPNSCFTYSDAGRALFGTRPVRVAMSTDLYGPAPGARAVFVRRRLARLVVTGRRLHLWNSLHDNVHGFDLHCAIDLDRGVVVEAESDASRLPYAGICTEPQGRIGDVIGQRADSGLKKRVQSLVGGMAGCAQQYDLLADLLKLLELPREPA